MRSAPEARPALRPFGTAKMSGFVEGRPGDRPPLVFLHGLTFDHRMWLPALAALRALDPDRLVLVLDLPGHGDSPLLERCDPEDLAAAVASATHDAGLDRPVIVGHSISAIIATVYGMHYPTQGVVNVDTRLDSAFASMLQANRALLTGPAFGQLWPTILAGMRIDLLPEEARTLLRTDVPDQDVVLAYWRQALVTRAAVLESIVADGLARLRQRGTPYLIVAGSDWSQDERRAVHAQLPQVEIVTIPDSGHFPHLADPQRFARLLEALGSSTAGPASHVEDASTSGV